MVMILPLVGSALITADNTTAETDPYGATGFNWDYVYNYKNSSSVAVDDYWLLTAAHVADDGGTGSLSINGDTYTQQEIVFHESADLALVRYDKALPGYYGLYSGSLYVGDNILMVGFGNTGTVTTNTFSDSGAGSGTKRWGFNEIDAAGWVGDTYMLGAGFNTDASPNEAGVGVHDSGGGSFIYDGSEWQLVGINLSRGPDTPPYTDSYMASMPAYSTWVAETVPEPSTAVLLAGVAALLGVVHRIRSRLL